jgi:hypothetical protein
MRKAITAACCVALMGSVSVASAATTGPQTMKSHDPMNASAMMKKHKKKHHMMKGDMDNGMDKGMDKGIDKGMTK